MDPLELQVRDLLKGIPYKDSNVLDSNLIYEMGIEDDVAFVTAVLPGTNEDEKKEFAKKIADALKTTEEINKVQLEMFDTAEEFQKAQKAEPEPLEMAKPGAPVKQLYLENYKNVILVASGKGGVGKSTVAMNLALALKNIGKSVSVFDADVYGPSIPMMMGARGAKPKIAGNKIMPLNQLGVDFLSIGNMVNENDALIWRGAMVHNAIQQMLRDTAWPGGDYMIIDMPPGTGDTQLSIAQMIEVTGAVVVSTPQDVALIDARRAVSMFDSVDIPVVGMVENMSAFICPKCGEETPIFSKGGTQQESELNKVPFLGEIPIELEVRLGGDEGKPVVQFQPDSAVAKRFIEIATKLDEITKEID